MFSNYGSLASLILKCGLATRKSVALSRHSNNYSFRPVMNKIQRNYCASKTRADNNAKITERALSNEILEILDSPDKIERDHKHYRFVNCVLLRMLLYRKRLQGSQTKERAYSFIDFRSDFVSIWFGWRYTRHRGTHWTRNGCGKTWRVFCLCWCWVKNADSIFICIWHSLTSILQII